MGVVVVVNDPLSESGLGYCVWVAARARVMPVLARMRYVCDWVVETPDAVSGTEAGVMGWDCQMERSGKQR